MSARDFIDTNILIYSLDRNAGEKHKIAAELITRYWRRNTWPWISVQVLQEMHVNLIRKGLSAEEATNVVHEYGAWNVVDNTLPLLRDGLIEKERWKISLWDGLILAAARKADASRLISEDLNHGQDYDGIKVTNPFYTAAT